MQWMLLAVKEMAEYWEPSRLQKVGWKKKLQMDTWERENCRRSEMENGWKLGWLSAAILAYMYICGLGVSFMVLYFHFRS